MCVSCHTRNSKREMHCISSADTDPSGHGAPGVAFLTAPFGTIIFLNPTKVGCAIKRAKDGKGEEWLCLGECGITWQQNRGRQRCGDSRGHFHGACFLFHGLVGILMEKTHFLVQEPHQNPVLKYHWKRHQSSSGMGNITAGSTKPPAPLEVCYCHCHQL